MNGQIKIGEIVITPHGIGEVFEKEKLRTTLRWGVKLDNNPFHWFPVMYFENEIRVATDEEKARR